MSIARTIKKRNWIISQPPAWLIRLRKAHQERIISEALRGITEIKVLIHNSEFFGFYKLGELHESLRKGKEIDSSAYPRYPRKKCVQLPTGKVTHHFKPKEYGYGPACMITTNKSTFDHLYDINKRLPDLNITRVEYAIDFYCKTPEAVADLFYLIRRYLYRRNAKRTSMEGGKFYGWQDWLKDLRERNAVYYIWTGKKSGKHIKVYERGKDSKKITGTQEWHHKDVDRVRIEFKLMRKALSQYGLSTLKSLLQDPNFANIASDYIQFKNFKFSPKLIHDWEDYPSVDDQGHQESFMQEVLSAKNTNILDNITQYIEDNPIMQAHKDSIIEVAQQFDKNWQKRSRRMIK